MEIVFLLGLILLNGLFAMSEIALVTARRSRLQLLMDAGDSSAAAAVKLGEDPTRFLSTIQIGITSIGVLNGIVGEAALAEPLAAWLGGLGLAQNLAQIGATGLVVVVITYVSIVLGELVPKRMAQSNPERLARLVARPINALAVATRPFVALLSVSTQTLLRLLGVPENSANAVTEEEIDAMLKEGTSAGVIELHEHTMVRNVFRLDERKIGSLMVPRSDVVVLDLQERFEVNMARVASSDHARFPVVRDSLNDVVGVLRVRKWLLQAQHGGNRELATQPLEEALYVPESISGMELLQHFRHSGGEMAFVIDEYGEVQGIVTQQDLIEAITGELSPSNPATAWAVQREDGSWLLDGHIPVPELKDRLGLDGVPDEARGRYHTLSGLIMRLTGRLPAEGDRVEWGNWLFEIVDMDGRTVDKVLATRPAPGDGDRQVEPPPA